ncbi:alpha/beta hydrolase [Scytonema tolypothrichoides VB-61278]|nr:alpha/beta hydrolase [Scytonema tolypothrichoides VB-61278]
MQIYGPDPITFEGVTGHRYWFNEPFSFTGVADIDERLSGFPVAVFLPCHRPAHQTPLVIGLQGMSAPYGWNAFIVPTLTQMGIAVALFDTPFAGERSLVRTFSAVVQNEIKPLVDGGIAFDTQLLLRIFRCTTRDIGKVVDFCCDRYSLTDGRVALFGVSMGVLQSAHAFTANGLGERLLGAIGHANLQSFAKSWGYPLLSDLAASPLGKLAEGLLERFQPELKPVIKVMQVAKKLKDGDEYSRACNPMTYIDQVEPHRRVRLLLGATDHIVNIGDARWCAKQFPDGACYVVPGMGHGQTHNGKSFVDHVRYFLVTQLADWRG